MNNLVTELKSITRERKTEESAIEGFTKERITLADEVDRLNKTIEETQGRYDALNEELIATQEKVTGPRGNGADAGRDLRDNQYLASSYRRISTSQWKK